MGEIFVITEQDTLVPLNQQSYASEDLLQTLLAKYPSLLAGDQIDSTAPRRWLLVKREADVPDEDGGNGRWSLDHLFLDQDGIPTLVEVKRSTDTRIRREVVGQMLDYAANGVKYWPVESLRTHFEDTCESAGTDSDRVLSEFLGEGRDSDEFWKSVKTNLQAGRIRMLFVADEIPDELRRVIEFLNEQMDPAEVLGVEIKQFAGGALKTLVPRVIGQTAEAEDRKSTAGQRPGLQWDEATFFQDLTSRNNAETVAAARKLIEWLRVRSTRLWWGKGRTASCTPVLETEGAKHHLLWITVGKRPNHARLEVPLYWWKHKAPFNDRARREQLIAALRSIPGFRMDRESVDGGPSIFLEKLAQPEVFVAFATMLQNAVSEFEPR